MYIILVFSLIIYTNALETRNNTEAEILRILHRHLDKIPDVESKYVLNEGLSKSISKYYQDKISVLPLFKMSVKIDRTPVKIPWTVGQGAMNKVAKPLHKAKIEYKYVRGLDQPPPERNLTRNTQ